MNHDFSVLCADQIEKLEKRLKSLSKAAMRDYAIALMVINDAETNQHTSEMMLEIGDILNDVRNKTAIFYAEAFNKVQRVLSQHLVGEAA